MIDLRLHPDFFPNLESLPESAPSCPLPSVSIPPSGNSSLIFFGERLLPLFSVHMVQSRLTAAPSEVCDTGFGSLAGTIREE